MYQTDREKMLHWYWRWNNYKTYDIVSLVCDKNRALILSQGMDACVMSVVFDGRINNIFDSSIT